jgi:Flp pilus assembly protein CpaB
VAIPSNRPQNRILLYGGIVFALLASGVVYLAVSKSTTASTPPAPTVQVVVASVPIDAGSLLSASNLTTRAYLVPDVPPDSYTTPSQVTGKVLPVAVSAGTPITEQLLTTSTSSGTGTLTVPSAQLPIAGNDVALAIPAHGSTTDTTVDQMTVGYYIQAGDQIDIIGDLGGPTATSHSIQYVFQDIPVLAVGYAATTTTPSSPSATATAGPNLSAPSYFVVEMTRSQAEQMTALLAGDYTTAVGGDDALVLKYVLRPLNEYGSVNAAGDFVPKIENSVASGSPVPSATDQPVTPSSLAGAFTGS